MTDTPAVADLRSRLEAGLGGGARAWLDQAIAEATVHRDTHRDAHRDAHQDDQRPGTPPWELRFAEAGRRCGAEHADAARLLLLHTARADTATLARLYHQGTAAERRAILRALPLLVSGPAALPLVEDALRTNDTRLVAAALGPYAAAHLPPHAWRHAVLKCLFTGVPVDTVAGLEDRARADAELARMLADYADERTAAGRAVPGDLHRVLALAAPPERPDRPAPAAPATVAAQSTPTGEEQES
ncbi:EboA domain-containing protein [Streptomyces sp. PmtG]